MSDKIIDRFDGQYRFLSNFYEAPLLFRGLVFENAEAAFHSQKCPQRAKQFQGLNASQAKQLGRQVVMRSDWDKVRDQVMCEVVFEKFSQNAEIRERLIATGEAELIEGNTWNDRYWGICNGIGQNKLGKILMRVRSEFLQKEQLFPLEEGYRHGECVAANAINAATENGYDIPIVREVGIPGQSVLEGLTEAMKKAGATRFVWLPQYGQNAEYLGVLKTLGWRVADVVKAPVYKFEDYNICNSGFLMERIL